MPIADVLDTAGQNSSRLIRLHDGLIVNLHKTIVRLQRIVDATRDARGTPAQLTDNTGGDDSDIPSTLWGRPQKGPPPRSAFPSEADGLSCDAKGFNVRNAVRKPILGN